MRKFLHRQYKKLETKDHELKYLFLEITRKCNLSCIHCGSDCSKNSDMKEMTADTWIQIIDYMLSLYNPFFVITGGEPLISNNLNLIINHLKMRRARWGMVTNGMALTPKRMDTLISKGLESITLSVDGDKETHTYIRQHPESWDRVTNSLKIIGESKVRVKDVVTCVYPKNLDQLDWIADLLVKNGITSWRLFRIFPKGAAINKSELLLDFEQSQFLLNWIANNRKKYKKMGLDISFSCEGYLDFSMDRKVRKEPFFCRSGINIASILADGTITGCNNNDPDFYQGNISVNDFKQIWEKGFKEYRNHQWKKTGICEDCNEWDNCLGNSIHLRDKNIDGPVFCYVKNVC